MKEKAKRFLYRVFGFSKKSSPLYMSEKKEYDQYFIGRFTYGSPEVYQWDEKTQLKIGSFCSIADHVKIHLGGEHNKKLVTTSLLRDHFPEYKYLNPSMHSKGDVVIGNDVWIGHGAIILSGVKIGNGAVIGAGSVVRGNIEPYSIYVGNPAMLHGMRFDDDTIAALEKISWWDWDLERIRQNVPQLLSEDVKGFIDRNI